MGLDAGERDYRPDLGRHHPCRTAWHRSLGSRAAGRDQYAVRRLGADRDGAAWSRRRSAFGRHGPLSGPPWLAPNQERTDTLDEATMALAKRYEQGEAGEMMGWSSHGEVPPKRRRNCLCTTTALLAVC